MMGRFGLTTMKTAEQPLSFILRRYQTIPKFHNLPTTLVNEDGRWRRKKG